MLETPALRSPVATRLLVGTCARVQPHVLKASVGSIARQILPENHEVDLFYVLDGEHNEHTWEMGAVLDELGASSTSAYPRPLESGYRVDAETHRWDEATFDHIAQNKDRLIQKAFDEDYDYLVFVDSDLVLEPTTLYSMLRVQADLVSAVFWTYWNGSDPKSLGPNVWLRHPYDQQGLGLKGPEFWRRLSERLVTRVAGGGACMLMNRRAIESGLRYYPRIPDLPDHGMYRGEDRSFCIRAKRMHLGHVADPWPDIWHLYSPSDRTEEQTEIAVSEAGAPRCISVQYGDLINICLRHLEDDRLLDRLFSVRGRLGALRLAPEIEDVLTEMKPGEKRILEIKFPDHWPQTPGESRMVELELVDVKPYGFAPNRADHVFRGLSPPEVVV